MIKDIVMYFIFGLIFFSPLFWYISEDWRNEQMYFTPLTTIEIEKYDLSLGTIPQNKTITTIFKIKNTGGNPLIISNIQPFVNNSKVIWDKNPIKEGDTSEIKVTFQSNSIGVFLRILDVTCNTMEKKYQLKIRGNVDYIPNDFIHTTKNSD